MKFRNDHRNIRDLRITSALLIIGIDRAWLGVNVYTITDLQLLIEWWNKALRYAGDNLSGAMNEESILEFHAAVWIRINDLHEKTLLKFRDITDPDLLRKVVPHEIM